MPAVSFDALQRSLKSGEIAPVYYLYGQEDILKEDAIRLLVERGLDPGMRDFNLDHRSLGQVDPEELGALLETLPMLAERRIVILRDPGQRKRKSRLKAVLERYLARPSDQTVLVIVQDSGDDKPDALVQKYAVSVDFEPLKPERVLRWVAHEAGLQGVGLSEEAIHHLVEVVGPDLGVLRTEIAKIAGLGGETPLGVDQIAGLLGVRRGETLPGLRDLIMEGREAEAAAMVQHLLEQPGMTGVKVVTTLGTALVGLGLARSWYDRGLRDRALAAKLMERVLAVRPFGLGNWKEETARWARWAPAWTPARIRTGLRAVLAADRALKNTRLSDDRGVVLDTVFQLGPSRQGEAA